MDRIDYEKWAAEQRGRTVEDLRKAGYCTAPCPDDPTGWQCVAIPLDAGPLERETILKGLMRETIKRFGDK